MHRAGKNTREYLWMVLRCRAVRMILPVALAYVMLTLGCDYFRRIYEGAELLSHIMDWCHMILPMFACWWGLVIHNEWISGEGNELLYLYLSPGVVLKAQLVAEAAYLACIAIYFAGIQTMFGLQPFFLLRLCAEALFIGGVACFLGALVRNTGAPLLLAVVYCAALDQAFSTFVFPEMAASIQTQEMSGANVLWAVETVGIAVFFHVGEILIYKYLKKYE